MAGRYTETKGSPFVPRHDEEEEMAWSPEGHSCMTRTHLSFKPSLLPQCQARVWVFSPWPAGASEIQITVRDFTFREGRKSCIKRRFDEGCWGTNSLTQMWTLGAIQLTTVARHARWHSSGTDTMGSTNHFLIRLNTCSTGNNSDLSVNPLKSPGWGAHSSQGRTYYYYFAKWIKY